MKNINLIAYLTIGFGVLIFLFCMYLFFRYDTWIPALYGTIVCAVFIGIGMDNIEKK